eukprot:3954955-Amphidinium_carterae.1
MLGALKEDIFSRYGLNIKDSSLKRAGIQRIFVRLPMDTIYTNPVTGPDRLQGDACGLKSCV